MTTEARDRLILDNLPLVRVITVRIHENLPVHVDFDDLLQSGIVGLIDAVSKFDPGKKVPFKSYAQHRIKGEILDSLRRLDPASRDIRRRQKQVAAATLELAAILGRMPADSEIAETLGMDIDRWHRMMVDLRSTGLISASTRKDEDLPDPEFPTRIEVRPDNEVLAHELGERLLRALDILTPRYRRVLELYYRDEITMREIGKMLGVNESRISQMHAVALQKLRHHLERAGITPQAFAVTA